MTLKRTDFFRIAVAGDTIDGREITAQDIRDMAETFDFSVYPSKVWLEHMRSIFPDGYFKNYGNLVSLKCVENDPLGDEKVTALYAQLDVHPEVVEWAKDNQKQHGSIEIVHNYRNSGKAYCSGLGLTDSPASFGTEALKFNRENSAVLYSKPLPINFSIAGKTAPEATPEATTEKTPEVTEEPDTNQTLDDVAENDKKLFSRLKEIFTKLIDSNKPDANQSKGSESGNTDQIDQHFGEIKAIFSKWNASTAETVAKQNALEAENAALKESIEGLTSQFSEIKTILEKLDSTPEQSPHRYNVNDGDIEQLTV